MPLAAVVGVLVVVALLASVALALGSRPAGARSRIASALRISAVIVTVVVAALVALPAWQDSGAFMFALIGIPVACAMLVLGVDLTGRPTALVTWIAAAAMLAWSLVTSVGAGLYFLGPSVLMIAAAVGSTRDRRDAKVYRAG